MKKSLLALAALSAIAGAAQAQSSVTVYGILDVGYVGGTTRANSSATATNGGATKSTVNQFGESAEQTSRLGLKGSEDLGGGKSAFFTAEFYLYPQDTTLSGNSNGGLLSRQTFVGLKQNGVGQAAFGLQYTPVFNAQAVTDAGMNNNIVGNVIYPSSTGISNSYGTASATGAQTNTAGETVRTANTLTIASDKFAGFGVNAMYTLNNANSSQTANASTAAVNGAATIGGNTNASGWGLGADYTYNKFYITGAYQSLKALTTTTDANAATSQPWTNSGLGQLGLVTTSAKGTISSSANSYPSTQATNVTDNQGFVGATYDFGILKAYAQWITRTATSTVDTSFYVKRQAEQIGVRSYITPVVEAWATAGLGRYTAFGQNQPTANFNAWQLGSNYWLSKRTNLYAIYGQTITSNSAAGTTTTSAGLSNYALGVRHTF